jgi:hypothetical protein
MHQSLSDDAIDPINRKLKEPLPFDINDIVKGRVDKKSYTFFYSTFVPLMDTENVWNDKITKANEEMDLVTVSSEVFALTTLENKWDHWIDLYVQSNGKVATDKKFDIKSIESSVPAKYTREDHSNLSTNEVDDVEVWSVKGIKRFNSIFNFVKEDRIKHSQFFVEWLKEEKKLRGIGNQKSEETSLQKKPIDMLRFMGLSIHLQKIMLRITLKIKKKMWVKNL